MPVTAESLVSPIGEIDHAFFPGMPLGDFDEKVAGILTRATERATVDAVHTVDAAVRAAAYAESFRAAIAYHATRAASFSLPEQGIQQTHTGEQLQALREQMLYWDGVYNVIVDKHGNTIQSSGTVAVPNVFNWM